MRGQHYLCLPIPPCTPEQRKVLELRLLVRDIYNEFNPAKLADGTMDSLFIKYAGNELNLYVRICKKYEVAPEQDDAPMQSPPAVSPATTSMFVSFNHTADVPAAWVEDAPQVWAQRR